MGRNIIDRPLTNQNQLITINIGGYHYTRQLPWYVLLKVTYFCLGNKIRYLFIRIEGSAFNMFFAPLCTRSWFHEFVMFFKNFSERNFYHIIFNTGTFSVSTMKSEKYPVCTKFYGSKILDDHGALPLIFHGFFSPETSKIEFLVVLDKYKIEVEFCTG